MTFGRRPRVGVRDGQCLLALALLGALMPSDSLAGQEPLGMGRVPD